MAHKAELSSLNKILRRDDPIPPLADWLGSVSQKALTVAKNRIISFLLDRDETEMAGDLVADLPLNRETAILKIRYHLAVDQLFHAVSTYIELLGMPDGTRKRHATLIMNYMLAQSLYPEATQFYLTYIADSKYVLDGTDIAGFLDHTIPKDLQHAVLETLIGQPITVSVDSNVQVTDDGVVPDGKLDILDFSSDQIDTLITNLSDTFKAGGRSVSELDMTTDYQYIIDGANVLFFGDRKICANGYERITKLIHVLHQISPDANILLVLHQRHFEPKKEWKWKHKAIGHIKSWQSTKNLNICKTPRGFCDDYYSLLNAFPRPKALLITNDKFRDHVFKLSKKDGNLDLIAQWRAEKVIEYDFDWKNHLTLQMPIVYSHRIQKVGDYMYLPTPDGWYRV